MVSGLILIWAREYSSCGLVWL